jgi:hypothetical protein
MWYCSGVSCSRHSASVFVTFSLIFSVMNDLAYNPK